jgi:PAS domain S-box-containing protein
VRHDLVQTGGETDLVFPTGGGEMGARMRAHDWSGSPLGAPEGWSHSLRTVVSLVLNCGQPMFVCWGPELGLVYNDAYARILATKHPSALGRPFLDVWSEIRADLVPLVDRTMSGEAFWYEGLHLVMQRHGYPEDTWFDFSYSPLPDEDGRIIGLFCACTETTPRVLAERAVKDERDRLYSLFEDAPGFVAALEGPEHVFTLANRAYRRLVGGRDLLGKSVAEALPEVAGQGFVTLLDKVYASGEPHLGQETLVHLQRSPGAPPEPRWVDFIYQPIREADGAVSGIFVEGSDVTDRRAGEVALRESESRFRTAADSSPALMWMSDENAEITFANQRYRTFFGVETDAMLGEGWRSIVHPEDVDAFHAAFLARFAVREPAHLTVRVNHPELGVRWLSCDCGPRYAEDGAFLGYVGVNIDVTEQKRSEEQMQLLLDELNHRVKNNLATVQSIAYQTARHAPDLPTFRKTFDQRLVALSRTHDILTANAWENANLRAVLESELGPYGDNRVRLDGPAIRLNPQQALALGLVVHELATNAAKYGALSHEDSGCVRVTWSGGDDRLAMLWSERDGPETSPPERRGFGSRLIERGVQEMGGEVVKDWLPEGLDCRITIPL